MIVLYPTHIINLRVDNSWVELTIIVKKMQDLTIMVEMIVDNRYNLNEP